MQNCPVHAGWSDLDGLRVLYVWNTAMRDMSLVHIVFTLRKTALTLVSLSVVPQTRVK